MLTQLTIHNYAIVDSLDVELSAGMTVITGETGAGKSIMLDALGLTLGDRADKDVIRTGAERADITACFDIASNTEAFNWLKENDFSADEPECLLRRVITSEGRSRAYINGQQTTLNELKALGELLIDIHSQHEHQSLLRPNTHQRMLDEYCETVPLAEEVAVIARDWQHLSNRIDDLKKRSDENSAQVELLTFQVKELDELGLKPGDLAAIEEEHQRLSHAGETLRLNQQILDVCSSDEESNLLQGINQALALSRQLPVTGKHMQEACVMLENARIQLEEASTEIQRALNETELDPERLLELDEQLTAIHQIARKHRLQPAGLLEHHQELLDRLNELAGAGGSVSALEEKLKALDSEYRKKADILSKQRLTGAKKLEKAITAILQNLGMPGSAMSMKMRPTTSSTPSPQGLEQCSFFVSTNQGQVPMPLIKVASGGELSRISLAIQVVTAQTSSIPTLVFDEVDVGIGGGVARTVGELLRTLGDKGQVICVTHQPQVASQCHQHLYVSKQSGKDSTSTQLRKLGEEERVEEIARMLGGDSLSRKSLEHARELIA